MSIDKILSAVQDALDSIKLPAEVLPKALIWCTAIKRPGGSVSKCTAEIISSLPEGFHTGVNSDGSANMVNQYTYAVVNGIYNMITKDMVVSTATPPLSIRTQGFTSAGEAVETVNVDFIKQMGGIR